MSRRVRLTGLVLVAVLAGCASSAIGTAPDGLRVFTWARGPDGAPVACPAFAAAHPVSGILRGDADDPQELVWLEGQGGVRLSVVWPAGFTVTFEPEAVLRDDRGEAFATAGDMVELGQVEAFANTGTFGDPYIASGSLFAGCYPFVP